jgi:hypothetical protein
MVGLSHGSPIRSVPVCDMWPAATFLNLIYTIKITKKVLIYKEFTLPIATWKCSVTLMETSERTNQPTVRRLNLIPYFRPTAWFRSFVCLYCSSIFQSFLVAVITSVGGDFQLTLKIALLLSNFAVSVTCS